VPPAKLCKTNGGALKVQALNGDIPLANEVPVATLESSATMAARRRQRGVWEDGRRLMVFSIEGRKASPSRTEQAVAHEHVELASFRYEQAPDQHDSSDFSDFS
jgi:hypothetical protein